MDNILITILALISIILTTYMVSYAHGWKQREEKYIRDSHIIQSFEEAQKALLDCSNSPIKFGKSFGATLHWNPSDDGKLWTPDEEEYNVTEDDIIGESPVQSEMKKLDDPFNRRNLN